MLKRVLALTLTLVLSLSMFVTAFAAQESNLDQVESDLTDEILQVNMPLALAFALDPFELKAEGTGQIYADKGFVIINATEAPVMVSLEVKMTATTGVTFATSASALSPDDINATEKKLYMSAIVASTTAVTGATNFASTATTAVTPTYDPTATAAVVPFVATAANAQADVSFGIALAAPATSGATVTFADVGTDCYTAFNFHSVLNTYADWKVGDITLTGKVKMTVLKQSTYDSMKLTMDADAPGLVLGTGGVTKVSASFPRVGATNVTVTVNTNGAALTSATLNAPSASFTQVLTASDYTFVPSTGVFTFIRTGTASLFKTSGFVAGNHTVDIVDVNGKQYQIELTITA